MPVGVGKPVQLFISSIDAMFTNLNTHITSELVDSHQ